jgi:hypothetical protein
MPTYQPEFHADLPRVLFFKRDGGSRGQMCSVSWLRTEELADLKVIRDRMIDLYFSPSVTNSWGKPQEDRGWLGISTAKIGEDGKPIGTRTYKPGHRKKFMVPVEGGGTAERSSAKPYVIVPDDVRGKTSTIIEKGKEKILRWKVWERSISAWIRHLSGDESMLAFWDDRRGDDLTCILFDIDGPSDPSADIGQYMSPWVEAVADIEAEFSVNLGVNWMLSGSKGVWGQIFLDGPISKPEAASLLTAIAIRVVDFGYRVRMGGQTVKWLGSSMTIGRWFIQDSNILVDYTLDDGNIGNRNCRLPWASHYKTRRIAHFVLPDGSLPESQVGHLFGIERVSASEVSRVAREVSAGWRFDDDPATTTNDNTNNSTEGKHRDDTSPTDIVNDDAEIGDFDPDLWPFTTATKHDHGNSSNDNTNNDNTNNSTEGKHIAQTPPVEQKVRLTRHPVPNTNGQMFILLDDYLTLGDDGECVITGLETIDEIMPMMYGAAYGSVIDSKGLLDVYDWLTARNEPITEDGVVDLLMSRYIGSDHNERRPRFASMVRSDIKRNKHIRAPKGRRARAVVAANAARHAGINNDLTIRILQAICTQSSVGRRISTISALIAYVVGILSPDETDVANIKAAKVRVGEHIKTLVNAGLLIVHQKGHPKVPSVYEVVIPDDRRDDAIPCASEATDAMLLA